jgi:hypothetical protein
MHDRVVVGAFTLVKLVELLELARGVVCELAGQARPRHGSRRTCCKAAHLQGAQGLGLRPA